MANTKSSASLSMLPFLIAEEGFKKNEASEKLQALLTLKIGERAEIEMKYIRLLQTWSDGLVLSLDYREDSAFYMENPIAKTVLRSVKDEADTFIKQRQHIYNRLMAEGGPFGSLQKSGISRYGRYHSLGEVKEEFCLLTANKRRLDDELGRRHATREKMALEVADIEKKLAHRSRLSSARRLNRGKRKVDNIRDNLTKLRQLNEENQDKITSLEQEMAELEASAIPTLQRVDGALEQFETQRLKLIKEQTKVFLQELHCRNDHNRSQFASASVIKACIEGVNQVDQMLGTHWNDVEINARRYLAGQRYKLWDFVSRTMSDTTGVEGTLLNAGSINSNGIDTLISTDPFITDFKTRKILSPNGVSDSPATRERCGGTGETTVNGTLPGVSNLSVIGSVEILLEPPEVEKDPSRPFPVREFCPAPDEETSEMLPEPASLTAVQSYHSALSETADELGKLRDVRVIALHDFNSPRATDLKFKKGQIIKQKAGSNEDGYCYGWTRESRLHPKRFGHYPKSAVTLFRPD